MRDQIIGILLRHEGFMPSELADQILALEVEGWVVIESSIKISNKPAKIETTERPATQQEVNENKAVWA